jgi:hypothetical protein
VVPETSFDQEQLQMDALEGIWRLVDSRAWNESTERLSTPYGAHPMGHIVFSRGRMLVALCKGDPNVGPDGDRSFSSHGGRYSFDGLILECEVDVASDRRRIGTRRVRDVVMMTENEMLWRPPSRLYGTKLERRELVWERVWQPGEDRPPR